MEIIAIKIPDNILLNIDKYKALVFSNHLLIKKYDLKLHFIDVKEYLKFYIVRYNRQNFTKKLFEKHYQCGVIIYYHTI